MRSWRSRSARTEIPQSRWRAERLPLVLGNIECGGPSRSLSAISRAARGDAITSTSPWCSAHSQPLLARRQCPNPPSARVCAIRSLRTCAGGRLRHSDRAGTARSRRREHHHDGLHPRPEPMGFRGSQTRGPALTVLRCGPRSLKRPPSDPPRQCNSMTEWRLANRKARERRRRYLRAPQLTPSQRFWTVGLAASVCYGSPAQRVVATRGSGQRSFMAANRSGCAVYLQRS